MTRILYVHSRKASFVAIDRAILAERFEVEDLYQPGRVPNPLKVVRGVLRCDLVFGWFASWHTFLPITLAWLMRKPSVLIMGGFDTANMPDIGYGHQQGGLRMHASRWIFRRATRLITNSSYSLTEIERNTPIPASRVTVVHHGVPDPFGEEPGAKEREALTVGAVDRGTLIQKGQLPFVEAARELSGRALRAGRQVARRGHRGAARGRAAERRVHGLALPGATCSTATGARPCTCRPRGTRASGWPSRRRCWPVACPWW